MEVIDIEIVKRANREAGKHWFSDGATRFFRSRYPQQAYKVGDLAYFITSEQFDYGTPRLYTVRIFSFITGEVDTVGEFHKLSRSAARSKLNSILKDKS